jgi:predicted transcriptional regulator
MQKPIFDVLLSQREWAVIKALHMLGNPASTRAVYERTDGNYALTVVHLTLNDLAKRKLITRTRVRIDRPHGLVRLIIWELSEDGKVFFS